MKQKINPPVTIEITDDKSRLKGWLAIDSIINNHCCGGLRMLPDISAPELTELAKAMTLKHGFLGIPHGGAKAGILCDENTQREHKLCLLEAFGLKIQNFLADRSYLPGPDMGTNNQDIRYMIIRKIDKIILGKVTPFQIVAACTLGVMIGFLPGFSQVSLGAPPFLLHNTL